jgi:hypothetical protein
MHGTSIYGALIDARMAELRRDAQRVVTPRIAHANSNKIRRWTAALATCLKPSTRSILVARYAI